MFEVNVKTNLKEFERTVSAAAYKQIPFATARALTAVARDVKEAEKQNTDVVLDRPRPFTQNAVRVISASKGSGVAKVVLMDTTARYLEPYEFGGMNALNGRSLLKPIASAVDLDQYGNLPRSMLKRLKARPDVFIGRITFRKSGKTISGVWQRPPVGQQAKQPKGAAKGRAKGTIGALRDIEGVRTGLKLLIKFDDAHQARQHLGWFDVARATVKKNFNARFTEELAKALASAKK
jgi:hypothetical protein